MKIFIILLLPLCAWGNTNYKAQLDELLHLKPEAFSKKIEAYRKNFESYFRKKKAICSGEFSANILEEDAAPLKKELTKSEKKLCLGNMKGMQRDYINGIFLARKRYMEYLYKKRIQNLIEAKDQELKELNAY